METFHYQKEIDNNFFNFLDHLPENILESIIKNEITTLMSIRRRRTAIQTSEELMNKLDNPPTQKKGEHKELIEVMRMPDEINAVGISPRLAGELADHAYYRLQDNIPKPESFENWYKNHYLEFIGIEKRSILIFCILKYSTRIDHGNESKIKDLEHEYLNKYLSTHPELTNMWLVQNNDEWSFGLFNLIEEINR